VLDSRLEALASKQNTDGREVRWYKKDDLFCLPYASRQIVERENTEDELLKASVSEVFRQRATAILRGDNEVGLISKVVALCHRSLEITFEKQGLELASFVLGTIPRTRFNTAYRTTLIVRWTSLASLVVNES